MLRSGFVTSLLFFFPVDSLLAEAAEAVARGLRLPLTVMGCAVSTGVGDMVLNPFPCGFPLGIN